jgi:alpha-tubulin suppressor-like RCC1 family protein
LGLGDTDNRGDNSSKMGDNLTIVDLGTGRTATAIEAGDHHTCAILDDASLKCWGENGNGQLGLGAGISNRGDGSGEMGDNLTAINLGSGRTATSITTGTGYTCVLLDDDSVKCWGRADYGQLGAGKTEEYNEPNASPIDLGTGITATAIASGYFHTCAILDNSSIKCWGRNDSGQLGIGDTGNRGDGTNSSGLTEMGDNLPAVDLGAGRTARAISAGDRHTCVVLDNTSLKCWGKNESGQLGLGDNSPRGDNSSEMGDNLPVISL